MRINPIFDNAAKLMMSAAIRRLYGGTVIILAAVLFSFLPAYAGPSGLGNSGLGTAGPPELLFPVGLVSVIVSTAAFLVSLSLLTGRIAETRQWLCRLKPHVFIPGKLLYGLCISSVFSLAVLPFTAAASRIESGSIIPAVVFTIYMLGIFNVYFLIMEISAVFINGFPVIRRIMVWALYFIQLLLSPRLLPSLSPYTILSSGDAGALRPAAASVTVLLLIFIGSVIVQSTRESAIKLRETDDE